MNSIPREKHLGFLINDVARLIRRTFDQRAQSLGLTRAQWQVLAHLHHNEGCNQASVADALDVEPITLSRHIDRLETMGYVTRLPDPYDRRARRLRLTETVRPLLDGMRQIGIEVLAEALEGVSPDKTEELIETLTLMRANMAARSLEAAPEKAPEQTSNETPKKKARR